jgi:hypothetical protein
MGRAWPSRVLPCDPSHALAAVRVDAAVTSSFALSCDVPCSSVGSKRWVVIIVWLQPIVDDVPQGW